MTSVYLKMKRTCCVGCVNADDGDDYGEEREKAVKEKRGEGKAVIV